MVKFQIAGCTTLAEVMSFLSVVKGKTDFICGGTDYIIQLKNGKKRPDFLIDLSQIHDLNYIEQEEDKIKIGAATTFTQIAANSILLKGAECLAQAAGQVGSVQIRNRAAIGGNISSASPAGDSLPALRALQAVITIAGVEGFRRVPFEQVIRGIGETCLKKGELITEVEIPALEDGFISSFKKIGIRTAVTIARLNMAAVVKYDRDRNIIREARLAVGALGKTTIRLTDAEQFLQDKEVNSVLANGLAVVLTEAVDKAIPGRNSQAYKRSAVRGLAFDIFNDLFGTRFG